MAWYSRAVYAFGAVFHGGGILGFMLGGLFIVLGVARIQLERKRGRH